MTKKDQQIDDLANLVSNALDAAINGIADAGIEKLSPQQLMATLIAFEVVAKDGINDTADEFNVPETAITAMRQALTMVFDGMMSGVGREAKVAH